MARAGTVLWRRHGFPIGHGQRLSKAPSTVESRTGRTVAQAGNASGAGRNGRGGLYRDELLAQVTSFCDTVGFSLARNVLKVVANVEDAGKIQDMAKLTMAFEKLQDLARGVERLRTAIGKCGVQRYAALCQELNLASDSLDDIPDRATLRRLLQTLEA